MIPNEEKVRRVNALTNELDRIYHRSAQRLGIPDSVLRVLYILHERGGAARLQDICLDSGISKQTINSALRNLERDGILYLEPDGGRAKRVCLTETGRRFTDDTAARLYAAESAALCGWTEEELALYQRLMEKFIRTLGEQVDALTPADLTSLRRTP